MMASPYHRQKNELVAHLFLPLLEQHPDWRAVTYLNLELPQAETSFYDFLAHWYRKTPPPNRKFITQAMSVFNFRPPGDDTQLLTSDVLVAEPTVNVTASEGAAGPSRN
jgi:hypothetical protein